MSAPLDCQHYQIKDLPYEDTIWTITDQECYDDEKEEDVLLLTVADSRKALVGSEMTDSNGWTEQQMLTFLLSCMQMPLSGMPRKPVYVRWSAAGHHCWLTGELDKLGIHLLQGQLPCSCKKPALTWRACIVCQRRGSPQLFNTCYSCQAVFFCSDKCERDMNLESCSYRHADWCEVLALCRHKASLLAQFPFSFAEETTSSCFDDWKLRCLLEYYEVFGKGLWQRLVSAMSTACPHKMPQFGDLQMDVNPYGLAKEGELLLHSSPSVRLSTLSPLTCWKDYYEWRGVSLDSPIAILLSPVLTLYHILMTASDGASVALQPGTQCTLHVVGAAMEADIVPTFLELGTLIPDVCFDIHMIGPEISRKAHQQVTERMGVKITLHRGLYHKFHETKPDVVVGFNAGLSAYRTWPDTLCRLKADEVTAYFTDYREDLCLYAKQPVEGLHLGSISQPAVNPFRSPLRMTFEECDLPGYSNGFIYHLVYM